MKELLQKFESALYSFNYRQERLNEAKEELATETKELFNAMYDIDSKTPFLKEGKNIYQIGYNQYEIIMSDGVLFSISPFNPIKLEL